MSKTKFIVLPGFLILLVGFCVVCGYFSHPIVSQWIPGQMEKKASPEFGAIYQQSASLDNTIRNPVIVVPGMMGSTLQNRPDKRIVWGVFDNESIDPESPEDVRLLACPIDGSDLDEFDDGVYASGVLGTLKINIAGLLLKHRAYLNVLQMLGIGGYRDEELGLAGAIDYGDRHFNCFQFPYDWRRDNAENARHLHTFLLERKEYVKEQRKKYYGYEGPVKFDIVAHSMGGLVSRYYLRYGDQGPPIDGNVPELDWRGCEHVDRVILVGPPSNGSAKSLISTHEGFAFSVFLDSFPSGLVASLPSIYQLLPNGPESAVYDETTGQPLDHFDIETWDQRGWGMLNPDQDYVLEMLLPDVKSKEERHAMAKAHVQKCLQRASAFQAALNVPAEPPEGTNIHLFAGDAIETIDSLNSNLQNRTLAARSRTPGDGTVTRKSALADRRTDENWSATIQSPIQFRDVRFLFDDHFGLTSNAEFTDNALFMLLEDPTKSSPTQLINQNSPRTKPSSRPIPMPKKKMMPQ